MAIVKQYHKDTNTVYVYDSQYYYDKEKKQSRSKRKLIGKIDEETGQIIPTGKRGRKKKTPAAYDTRSADAVADNSELQELRLKAEEQENENILLRIHMESMEKRYRKLLAEKDDTVRELQAQVKKLEGAVGRTKSLLKKAADSLDDAWPAREGAHNVSDIIKAESPPAEAAFDDGRRGSHQDL